MRMLKNVKRMVATALSVTTCLTSGLVVSADGGSNKAITIQMGSSNINQLPLVYNDDYFDKSAFEYNASLATASLALELSGFANRSDYSNQAKNAKKALGELGFGDIQENDDYKQKPTADSIGVVAANKKIRSNNEDYTLIPVVIRGGGYENEWSGNAKVGKSGDHEGFDAAATKAKAFVDDYIKNKKIQGKVKLWIVGYSRGGATASLLGVKFNNDFISTLNELDKDSKNFSKEDYYNSYVDKERKRTLNKYESEIEMNPNDLYVYTFETPMGMNTVDGSGLKEYKGNIPYSKSEKSYKAIYENIHNTINDDDFVTKVAPEEWGFARPGIDHKLIEEKNPGEILKVKEILSKMCVNIYGESKVEYKADKFQIYGFSWFSADISTQSKFLNEFLKMISNNIFEKYSNDKNMHIENIAKYKRLAYSENEEVVARLVGLIKSDEIFMKAWRNVLKTFLDENSKPALFVHVATSNSKLEKIVRDVIESAFVEYNLKQSKIDPAKQVSREEIDNLEKGISDLLISVNKIANYRYFYIFIKNIDNIIAMHAPEICLATLINKDENNRIAYLDQMKRISDNFVLNGSIKAA